MRFTGVVLLTLLAGVARAETGCQTTPTWTPCEIAFELSDAALRAHPNPVASVDLWGEFRSPAPGYRTYRLPAYWDGGRRMAIRFTPDETGAWTWRLTGNLAELEGKEGQITATESSREGFLRAANLHFWMHPQSLKPHLWMGDDHADLFTMERGAFERLAAARAEQKFTHLRGLIMAPGAQPFTAPDQPNQAYFVELDARMKALDQHGLVVDLVLAPDAATLERVFPTWAQRERFLRYVVGRYAAYNVSWEIAAAFEGAASGRNVIRELGGALRRFDPYNHPGSCGALVTSSPLLGDKWMSHVIENSPDPAIGAIEHQQYPLPLVSTGFAAGSTGAAFRKGLWDATMSGEWPVSRIAQIDSAETTAMRTWAETLAQARYWELEPYFELDGGRAVALSGVEYLVYIEKPGPLSLFVEKHSYDVYWINPATGERIQEKKDWKGDEFTGEPPDRSHDWILHLSRDGHKAGMAKSYKFESQPNQLQEVETDPAKIPFQLVTPTPDTTTLVAGQATPFEIRLKRETKGTRRMMYMLAGEVVLDGSGMRVLGTGNAGTLNVPREMLVSASGVLNMRIEGLNAAGKLYALDVVFPVTRAGP
ncbi:MAG: DUF5060 domain-containing protein [Bryobacteraceae bacterium]